jgi:hypothetical protein
MTVATSPFVPAQAGTQGKKLLTLVQWPVDSRTGGRKHAVLRTAMRGNERKIGIWSR